MILKCWGCCLIFERDHDVKQRRTRFANHAKSSLMHCRRYTGMRGNSTRMVPALPGQCSAQISHGLGAAKEPDRAITGRLASQCSLGGAEVRRTTLISDHKIGLRTRLRHTVGKPLAATALPAAAHRVSTPHDQHAATRQHLCSPRAATALRNQIARHPAQGHPAMLAPRLRATRHWQYRGRWPMLLF